MNDSRLTKYEALKLITPVVDNEVTEKERKAFFAFIETNEEVRRKYESVKSIKKLLRSRCPCSNAPKSLRTAVRRMVRNNCR